MWRFPNQVDKRSLESNASMKLSERIQSITLSMFPVFVSSLDATLVKQILPDDAALTLTAPLPPFHPGNGGFLSMVSIGSIDIGRVLRSVHLALNSASTNAQSTQ
jgi:hypothetical protein